MPTDIDRAKEGTCWYRYTLSAIIHLMVTMAGGGSMEYLYHPHIRIHDSLIRCG